MSVKLSTDLVMDVMRAAAPQRAATARASLTGIQGASKKDSVSRLNASPAATEVSAAQKKAHQQFEAAMLRNFTEQMMPKEASSFYGEGTAAGIWRSMQVDLMSNNLAKAGGIGIAEMLDKDSIRQASQKTAETLALNELAPAASPTQQLTTATEWPYFNRTDGAE